MRGKDVQAELKKRFDYVKNQILLTYCPALLHFLGDRELKDFISRGMEWEIQSNGKYVKRNTYSSLLDLIIRHKESDGNAEHGDWKTLNDLLNDFENRLPKLGLNSNGQKEKPFRDLLKSVLLDFNDMGILNVIGELLCFKFFSTDYYAETYEYPMEELGKASKSVDFHFKSRNDNDVDFLVEVLNVQIRPESHNNKTAFQKEIYLKVEKKINEKFRLTETNPIVPAFPTKLFIVLHGLTVHNVPFLKQNQWNWKEIFSSIVLPEDTVVLEPRIPVSKNGEIHEAFTIEQVCSFQW